MSLSRYPPLLDADLGSRCQIDAAFRHPTIPYWVSPPRSFTLDNELERQRQITAREAVCLFRCGVRNACLDYEHQDKVKIFKQYVCKPNSSNSPVIDAENRKRS